MPEEARTEWARGGRRICMHPVTGDAALGSQLTSVAFLTLSRLEFGRKQGSSKEEQERKRLIHKHKREFKGAVREIRKDSQFLARLQLSEIMER